MWMMLWHRIVGYPLDCKEDQQDGARCPSITLDKLLDRVIQHAELIYRASEETCTLFDKWLLHSTLIVIKSWISPLHSLQITLDLYDNAPDDLLNKTKWMSAKLMNLEQGVIVLIRKMLNKDILASEPSRNLTHYVAQPNMVESLLTDYTLLSCFKKDAHRVETFLKLLKCRQTDRLGCFLF